MNVLKATPERYDLRACPQCGSTSSQVQLTGHDNMLGVAGAFYVSQCAQCGLLFQNPALQQALLGAHYPDEYSPYDANEMDISRGAHWYIKQHKGYAHLPDQPVDPLRRALGRWSQGTQMLPTYVPDGRLLEIACASGSRLALLRRLGWAHCTGIEYSEHAARLAQARGFPVHVGRAEDVLDAIPDSSQDCIIASFVLEHLENPFAFTRQLAPKLRPGGQFILSTVNIEAPDFRRYRAFWCNLDLPRHFTLFRKRDLRAMLAEDFVVEAVFYQASPNDYVVSAEYRARTQRRLADMVVRAAGRRIFPLCVALALLGQTSRIVIHARKR